MDHHGESNIAASAVDIVRPLAGHELSMLRDHEWRGSKLPRQHDETPASRNSIGDTARDIEPELPAGGRKQIVARCDHPPPVDFTTRAGQGKPHGYIIAFPHACSDSQGFI